jgi:predicted metal-dependent hydrolase
VPHAAQLHLLFPQSEDTVQEILQRMVGRSITLVITDNSSSMLSYKEGAASITVRMHRMFLAADTAVLREIAFFINNRKAATPRMIEFIRSAGHLIKRRDRRHVPIITRGRYFDLQELFDEINDRYFNNRIVSTITWSDRRPQYGVRRRNLGCYDHQRDLIRISRYLDRAGVPRYFIAYVVYHEMLHADIGIMRRNGRAVMHGAEFRTRERLYHDYDRAMAWEKDRQQS